MFGIHINRDLLPMKGHYFLWNGGTAPIIPFMSVYAKQLGFSSYAVGIIYTVLPIAGMLAKPIAGGFADRYRCQKNIFIALQIISALTIIGFHFVPEISTTNQVQFSCDRGEIALSVCNSEKTNFDSIVAKQIGEEIGNATTGCRLECSFKKEEWDVLCKEHTDNKKCQEYQEKLVMKAHLKAPDLIGKCIYFEETHVELDEDKKFAPMCDKRIFKTCEIACTISRLNKLFAKSYIQDDKVFAMHQFWQILFLYVIVWMSQAIVVSVGDAICFELLDDPNKYGNQRQFGALGWGVFSIIAGILVDAISGNNDDKNYFPVFLMGSSIMLISAFVSTQICYTQKKISPSILRDIGRLLTNFKMIVFLLWCIFIGMCTALMWNFFFWLLEDLADKDSSQHSIKTIEGLVMAVQTLAGELPFFYLSGLILKRIGHIFSMSLILLVIGVRFIYYSVITSPWMALPIEVSNGFTFGLFYATMTSYASIAAPPGTETTTQGLVGATFEGIGVSTGSFMAGLSIKYYGCSYTFRIFGIVSLLMFLVFSGVQYLIYKNSTKQDLMARYAAPKDAIDMLDDDLQELKLVGH